jgi:hypothetical protein
MSDNPWRDEAEHLRARLSAAQLALGGCVYMMKQAYEEQPNPRSILAVALYNAIKALDCRWEPQPRAERRAWPTNGANGTTRLKKPRLVKENDHG